MQVPVEIAFHHMDSQPWAEDEIRVRVAKLEKIFGRLVSCRVRVEKRAKNGSPSIPPVVHIELGIPGRDHLMVSHGPEHLQNKYQRPDLHNAIHEAFRIAEDRLVELKKKMADRDKEALHEIATQSLGQVAEINPGQDFGFLMTKEGALLYFHRNSLLVGDFGKLKRGDEVFYVEAAGDTGPTAVKVRCKG